MHTPKRRHYLKKAFRKALKIVKRWGTRDEIATAHRISKNRHRCDCPLCKNPRRLKNKGKDKLTLQERRHHEGFNDLLMTPIDFDQPIKMVPSAPGAELLTAIDGFSYWQELH